MMKKKLRKPEEIKPSSETRVCIDCGRELPVSMYSYSKMTVDNCRPNCRECVAIRARKRRDALSEEQKAEEAKRSKEWVATSPKYKLWVENNRERIRETKSRYAANRTEEQKESRRKYLRERRRSPKNSVHHRMSTQIRVGLSTRKKGKKWESILGYTVDELVQHIEALFEPGMSWENMGEWHIDHYIPKSWFETVDAEQGAVAAWNMFNLQPKWADENLKKSNLHKG